MFCERSRFCIKPPHARRPKARRPESDENDPPTELDARPTQHYCSVGTMLPEFNRDGRLPAGIHWATWQEIQSRFGFSLRRQQLLGGLRLALAALNRAGCSRVYIDGSFVTVKREPGDYDACWDIDGVNVEALDSVFLDFSKGRTAQKRKYFGEFFPAQMPEGASGRAFLEFFQTDKETGRSKGIVGLNLQEAEL
jgi:hypothetical protein